MQYVFFCVHAQTTLVTLRYYSFFLQQSVSGDRNNSGNDVMVPLKVDTSGNTTSEGPPTPTHSETQDCIDARKCKYPLDILCLMYICSNRTDIN